MKEETRGGYWRDGFPSSREEEGYKAARVAGTTTSELDRIDSICTGGVREQLMLLLLQ